MSIEEFYERIGGDYLEAKGRLMNDAFIKRMLLKFADGYSLDELSSAMQSEDCEGLFTAAHSLKGVCGNLALAKLSSLASELTELTRGKSDVDMAEAKRLGAEILGEFRRVVTLIRECD